MKKICVLTGTRAEYGVLKPVMKAIDRHPELQLSLIVAGMHLSEEFGYTFQEIIKDEFKVDEVVKMNPEEDNCLAMALSIGKGVMGLAKALEKIRPDILIVIGDRTEALAGAIAAAYMNIIVAHISGGDKSMAGFDELGRHAITKLAHLHFTSTKKSAERVLKMGEEEKRVFFTGAPALDTIFNLQFPSKKEIENKFELDLKKPFLVLIQHSVTTEPEKAEQQITETLEAIKSLGHQTIIIYPNSDVGGRKIISKIKQYESLPFIKVYKSLPQEEYFSLLKYASALIGNSSSGIIESSSFGLPVVNLGIRQKGRERANNVIDADHNREEIISKIKKALSFEFKKESELEPNENPYGDGKAGIKIAKILAEIKINEELRQKKIVY